MSEQASISASVPHRLCSRRSIPGDGTRSRPRPRRPSSVADRLLPELDLEWLERLAAVSLSPRSRRHWHRRGSRACGPTASRTAETWAKSLFVPASARRCRAVLGRAAPLAATAAGSAETRVALYSTASVSTGRRAWGAALRPADRAARERGAARRCGEGTASPRRVACPANRVRQGAEVGNDVSQPDAAAK